MKLYLSSYRIGNDPSKLQNLVDRTQRATVIGNALDYSTDSDRKERNIQREIQSLDTLGINAESLDLRKYFDRPAELKIALKNVGFIWVLGGNCFVLRRAMNESGLDHILIERAQKSKYDNFVYGGFSAGVCVITPTLRGIHLADDPVILPPGYKNKTIWEGLGLIPYCFVPHFQSDHPESENMNQVITYFDQHGIAYKALGDGEVIITSTPARTNE